MNHKLQMLINKVRKEDVILWAGAGLSLYSGLPTGKEIATAIVNQMPEEYQKYFQVPEGYQGKGLPEIAEEFVQMNNGSTAELFQLVDSYLSKEPKSIEYHEKLSEIIQIKTIITTNYDDLFERAYGRGRLSVIVKNAHIPLANKEVKLYKIHGDMSNPESIVITSSDYNNFFSFPNNNESLWNKIVSLADEKSILFLGYSLEDPNVRKLIDGLTERVGKFKHQSFLVVPGLPPYKEQDLNKKGITYIDMTGEELIDIVHSEIMLKIVEDCETGFLNPSKVQEILDKKGLDSTFEIKKGKSSLVNFGSKDGEPLKLKFDIKKEDHEKFVNFLTNDIDNQEIEISSDAVSNVVSQYKGINLPPFASSSGATNLRVIKYPNKELTGSFVIKETNDVLENIKAEVFTNESGFKINFIHEIFTIQSTVKTVNNMPKQTFNISFNGSGDLAKDYKATTFLQNWIVNGYNVMFNNFTNRNVIPLISPKEDMKRTKQSESFIEMVNNSAIFFKNLFAIQNHFGVYFSVPDKITKEDKEALNEALMVVYNQKDKANDLNLTIDTEDKDYNLDEILNNEILSFKSLTAEPKEIEIFGEKISLGYCFIETLDGYVANKEEVLEQIGKKEKIINVTIKSRSNEMYFGYQEKKEI